VLEPAREDGVVEPAREDGVVERAEVVVDPPRADAVVRLLAGAGDERLLVARPVGLGRIMVVGVRIRLPATRG